MDDHNRHRLNRNNCLAFYAVGSDCLFIEIIGIVFLSFWWPADDCG